MTYTYTGDLTKALDWIRFTISDTEVDQWWLSDEEIQYFINANMDKELIALSCMEAILGKMAQKCDYKNGSISESLSDMYTRYTDKYTLYKQVMQKGRATPQQPQAGAPLFTIGLMDNHGRW